MFISQENIDHILRAGGNADAARMKIAAEFSKQKPLENRAVFLEKLYYGGNGLITDNGRFSAWYGDDGIHIATGDTSRYLRSTTKPVSFSISSSLRTTPLIMHGPCTKLPLESVSS